MSERTGTTWSELRRLVVSDRVALDSQEMRVAMDGTTVVMGNRRSDSPALHRGTEKSRKTESFGIVNSGEANLFNILPPTAASATLSGRVISKNGRGVSRTNVQQIDADGIVHTARTNSFGYSKFNDIEVGQTLFRNAFHKRREFISQIINFDDSTSDLALIAQRFQDTSRIIFIAR